MLSTGSLDRRIALQRNVPVQDLAGALTENWTQIGPVRWARRAPVGGDERFTAQQFVAREQVQWTVRWAEDIADIAPADRLIYPTSTDPDDAEIYDIIAVHEMGYRVGLVIVTARRTEALVRGNSVGAAAVPTPPPTPVVPSGAYAYADFADDFYWINGSTVTATSFMEEALADWGQFDITDSVVAGSGLTSGTLGEYGIISPAIAAAVQADFSIVLDCVFDYTDFSILEIYPADSPAFANLWDFIYGPAGVGVCTFEMNDYLNLLVQIATTNASHPTAKIGFSCNHASGVVSQAMTGETLTTGTAIAGHRAPPRDPFNQIAIGLQDSQTTHGNYIRTMTIYTPALSDADLNIAVGN